MSDDLFDQLVTEALASLPEEFETVLKNVAVVIEDEPDEEQRRLLRLPRYVSLFGLYQGVPRTVWGADRALMPGKITIFRQPILHAYSSEDEIKTQIRSTVLHEIGHYFGMSEQKLRSLTKE